MSHSSSQQDYNTASASSGCSSPLSEPTSTSSDTHQRSRHVVMSSSAGQQPTRPVPPKPVPTSRNRYGGSQNNLPTQDKAPANIPPSVSDYFPNPQNRSEFETRDNRQNSDVYGSQSRSRYNDNCSNFDTRSARGSRKERSKSPHRIEKQNSEKHEEKKKELSNQSNSFDDFLRMSRHAGMDDRQSSPSRARSNRQGISVSTSELARTKASETEEDIKKVLTK